MSWFKSKVSQKDFDQFEAQVIRVVDAQRREIASLRKELSDALTQLSDFKVRIAHRLHELETFTSRPINGMPLADSAAKRQEKPKEVYSGHSNATMVYRDNSMDLATGMLVGAMYASTNEDSGWTSSYRDSTFSDSSSSSSSDSSSSCGE